MGKTDFSNQNYEQIVYNILSKYPKCRDSKERLYVAVVSEIYGLDFVKNISLYNFFIKFSHDNKIPSFGTINRLSQKIQNQNEALRGKNYNKRHLYSETVKEDILNW